MDRVSSGKKRRGERQAEPGALYKVRVKGSPGGLSLGPWQWAGTGLMEETQVPLVGLGCGRQVRGRRLLVLSLVAVLY